jgi:ribosome maturation factor RimP
VGQRARVRAEALGGQRQVEIVAVPDDDHVTVRVDGAETTLPLAEIREARLVAELPELPRHGPPGRRRR